MRNLQRNTDKVSEFSTVSWKGSSGPKDLEARGFSRVRIHKGQGNKSKVLYQVNGIAAMHSQKISNALRTIDTWYPAFDTEEGVGPIAVEPYGAVTNLGKAFRNPKEKADFYTLFDRYALGEPLDNIEQKHYVMAVLVRGGVFGQSSKE